MRTFTATEAANILGVSQRVIIDWNQQRLLKPEIPAQGRGSRSIYSTRNLVQMSCFKEAFRYGLSRDQVRAMVSALNIGKKLTTLPVSLRFTPPDFFSLDEDPGVETWILFIDGTWTAGIVGRAGTVSDLFGEDVRHQLAHAPAALIINVTAIKNALRAKL